MTRTPMLIMLAAAAALAGCNKNNPTIVAGPSGDDVNATANAPVALPPVITASKVYRCDDNTVLYVNWLSDGSANVRNKPNDIPTPVAKGSADLKGDSNASAVTYKGNSCKA